MKTGFKEIGSNFFAGKFPTANELDDSFIKSKYSSLKNFVYPSLGRNAISIVLREINLSRKVALLPGYTCESVITPFLNENYELIFYNFHKDLTVNLEDLKSKLTHYKPGVMLLHGFYGFNTFLNAKSVIQTARVDGCIVIQDDTQTVFSEIELLQADYYIGSIRKWLEIPDGAYIGSNNKLPRINDACNEHFINLVLEAFKLKFDYAVNLNKELKPRYKKLYLEAQNLIDNDFTVYQMAESSKGILNEYNFTDMKTKRIENFNILIESIGANFQGIKPVISKKVSKNICPIYFPLYVENRNEYQKILSDNDVYATLIWPKSDFIYGLNEETNHIYDKIIGIPCDQRYNKDDMNRVVELFKSNFISIC
jgi:hypothetical protein